MRDLLLAILVAVVAGVVQQIAAGLWHHAACALGVLCF